MWVPCDMKLDKFMGMKKMLKKMLNEENEENVKC